MTSYHTIKQNQIPLTGKRMIINDKIYVQCYGLNKMAVILFRLFFICIYVEYNVLNSLFPYSLLVKQGGKDFC